MACLVACCWIGLSLQCPLLAGDNEEAIPPQLKAAQENALNWWRDSDNHITTVESTHTNRDGVRERTVVFILRDPNGRSLAIGRAGSIELQTFFEQRLLQRLALATQEHRLTQEQLDKLKLAANLDIGRFNRRVQEAEQDLNTPAPLDDVRSFKRHLSSISQDCDGELFGGQSLFGRVLATLLAAK
ncbi:MAG: hypothetical protein KDA51_19085 [Planctomycetales bacterium]|nr:hypothetical protein [Planctomycetales bacterium]